MGAVSGLASPSAATGLASVGPSVATPLGNMGVLQTAAGVPILAQPGLNNKMGGVVGGAFAGGAAPEAANIQAPVGSKEIERSLSGTQDALTEQQRLLAALQQQGGIGNQSAAYNQSQALLNQLQNANGIGVQQGAIGGLQNVAGQQQALANQYQAIASGQGPNPAQAALNNATGQNIANQAALMASQRGAGANVGLMARQAANQGAGIQQQAVGQAAQMQAQQQLAALGALGNQQQAIGGTQQAIAGIGGQQLSAQQAQQNALAQQAAQQVQQQMGAASTLNQAQQANQQQMLNAINQQNQSNVAMQSNINSANAGLKQTAMQGTQGLVGGVLNGAGAAIGGLAKGGEVKKFADGGETLPTAVAPIVPVSAPAAPIAGPQSTFGKFLQGWNSAPQAAAQPGVFNLAPQNSGAQAVQQGAANFGKSLGKLGNKKSSPLGETWAGADIAPMAVDTMVAANGGLAAAGGNVAAKSSAQKAEKKGNSYDNDKIPAMLSEGEIVLPRSVTQSKDPVRSAADFVAKVMAKRGAK